MTIDRNLQLILTTNIKNFAYFKLESENFYLILKFIDFNYK